MSIDTRDRILVEAERLFAAQGFAGASLSSVARAAGLGNAGLLHHFPSKAALYRAVLDAIAADLDDRLSTAFDGGAPGEQLQRLIEGLLSLHQNRPTALMIIAHEFLDRSGRIDEADVFPLAGVVASTVAVLEAAQREGIVRSGDPLALTAAMHGALIHGALGETVYRRTAARPPSPDEGWDVELARSALAVVLDTGPP